MSATEPVTDRTNSVSLADEAAVKDVLVNSILGLWDVVNNLTRIKPSKRDSYRVTIFGSARAKPGTVAYEETKRVAKALGDMNDLVRAAEIIGGLCRKGLGDRQFIVGFSEDRICATQSSFPFFPLGRR